MGSEMCIRDSPFHVLCVKCTGLLGHPVVMGKFDSTNPIPCFTCKNAPVYLGIRLLWVNLILQIPFHVLRVKCTGLFGHPVIMGKFDFTNPIPCFTCKMHRVIWASGYYG